MPIQVRCRGCEKALNVPDAARGKVVQCPKCGSKLRVPGGGSTETASPAAPVQSAAPRRKPTPPARESRPEAAPPSPEELLARMRLDDSLLEHAEEQICPYCAGELDEDEVVCPHCGMNLETGRMDAKEKKKRSRKGPDPALFYKKAWGDAWSFMLEFKVLALRTGLIWMNFAVLCCASLFMLIVVCKTGPTRFFWSCMTLMTFLGIPGWYWFLSLKIVGSEWFREKLQPDRIHFDFFANVAIGLRAVLWPFVVGLPFWLLLGTVSGVFEALNMDFPLEGLAMQIILGVALGLPYLAWPLANVHLVGKYRHPAWIGWELMKVFFKNIGPSLYFLLMALLVFAPVLGIIIAVQFAGGGANPFMNTHLLWVSERAVSWFAGVIGENWNPGDVMFRLCQVPLMLIMAYLVIAPLTLLAGFPALFMMRVNALLAYYNRPTLGVINKIEANTPAGFWPRFHAFAVDLCLVPLSSFLVTREKKAVIVGQLLNAVMVVGFMFMNREIVVQFFAPVWLIYNFWMYFAVQESGATKSTVGKDVFGLIVLTQQDKQMTLGQATKRFFMMLFTPLIGALMGAFSPQKQTLYDNLSQTKVVFVGDK